MLMTRAIKAAVGQDGLRDFRLCRKAGVRLPRLRLPDLPKAELSDARQFATGLGATLNGYQFGDLTEEDTRTKLTTLGMDAATVERVVEAARKRRAGRPNLRAVAP